MGGAELALVRLCSAINACEVDIVVVLFEDGPLVARLEAVGTRVVVMPLSRGVSSTGRGAAVRPWNTVVNAFRAAPFVVRLALLLRRLDPDVVHTTSLKADVLGAVAARLAGIPLVWHVHDRISPDYLPSLAVTGLRCAAARVPAAVVANSRATAETLGTPATIIYPGFTPDQIAPPGAHRSPVVPTVGLLGRISTTKGQLEFVRAARLVADARPDVRFRIVGSAMFGEQEYAANVRAEIDRLGLTDAMEMVGFVEDIAGEVDGLSAVIHASPVPEPFGQVLVEAMVRGVPVVATNAGGATELMTDDDGSLLGRLVPPGDVLALARAILDTLQESDTDRAHRASVAYRSALRRFTIQETARRLTDVWRDVARPPRGGHA